MERKTIVLVLRTGGDFSLHDVELISYHINSKWKSEIKPRIICLYDKARQHYDMGNFELIPLPNKSPGTWSRIALYSPEMEKYRPFLYMDLDTAVICSLENIFDFVKDKTEFITLEDFWQPNELATGLVWFPANSKKIQKVWDSWKSNSVKGNRMDYFLRKVVTVDNYWQNLTDTVLDFKPKDKSKGLLSILPDNANLVCFHGKPRINEANISWVKQYVKEVE